MRIKRKEEGKDTRYSDWNLENELSQICIWLIVSLRFVHFFVLSFLPVMTGLENFSATVAIVGKIYNTVIETLASTNEVHFSEYVAARGKGVSR